jgi:manganese transport protein
MNVALIVVAGTVCNAKNLSPADENTCSDLTLQSTPLLLRVMQKKFPTISSNQMD